MGLKWLFGYATTCPDDLSRVPANYLAPDKDMSLIFTLLPLLEAPLLSTHTNEAHSYAYTLEARKQWCDAQERPCARQKNSSMPYLSALQKTSDAPTPQPNSQNTPP